jgi:ubiquinol oxidase
LQVERHAFDTYDKFLHAHEAELKALPAPAVAKKYYETGDLYMFDEFHTTTPTERRRPRIETLYDVFVNVRNDEREHFLTMEAMQLRPEPQVASPNSIDPLSRRQQQQQQQQEEAQQQSSSSSSSPWSTVKQRQKAEEE